ASMIWIIGEYAERIDNADELLESYLESFPEEPAQVQLQLLTATVKLFLKKPTDGPQQMIQVVLNNATVETDNPDLQDRAYIYWRLLSTDPEVLNYDPEEYKDNSWKCKQRSLGRLISKIVLDGEVPALDYDHTGQFIFCRDAQVSLFQSYEVAPVVSKQLSDTIISFGMLDLKELSLWQSYLVEGNKKFKCLILLYFVRERILNMVEGNKKFLAIDKAIGENELKSKADRLRQAVLEKVEELAMMADTWQQRAKYNEHMINTLKFNHQQVYAQRKDGKEGCCDSEVDDTASCCNGQAIDFHLLSKGNDAMTCK
ncbi:LOW QUALITY PROTEIN: hypothetical protein M8C21_007863, partial [Ambrosia artemisiifolia]